MKLFRLPPLTLAIVGALALPAHAQSLLDLYEAARGHDAAYQSARSQYEATLHKADQAKAALLPQVGLNAGVSTTQMSTDALGTTSDRNYTTQQAGISASQPLYRPGNLASYRQGVLQNDLADAQLRAAEQDLIVRVSQAYFDVLGAQDSLAFVRAQKAAVAEQLASAKRNFEVGTATITDTREAQARYDLVIAQEIAADNDLLVKGLALDQLIGQTGIKPWPVLAGATLPPLLPDDVNAWIQQAQDQHPSLVQARLALDIASLETEKASAGHKPTLDLTAGYSYYNNIRGNSITNITSKVDATSIGVTFNMPLFAGFATQNRLRETLALEDKARSDLEATQRNVAQAIRAAYFGVASGLGQVKALEAAESSSQIALDANNLGYRVGVRINIDVLNSQSQLYQTKRDLAKARYDVLVGSLKLRQANGSLQQGDLQQVNSLLASAATPAVAQPSTQAK